MLYRSHKGSLTNSCDDYRKKYPWLPWDDLWSAAQEAFVKAIRDFDLTRNNGLNAYARAVRFALQGILEDHLRNGAKGEGRAGKWLSGDWENRRHLTPRQIVRAMPPAERVSEANARDALEAETAIREGRSSTIPLAKAAMTFRLSHPAPSASA